MSGYYDNQNSSAPGITLAHAVNGELVGGRQGIPQGGNIQPAGLNSMAPHGPRKVVRKCTAKEGCKGSPMKDIPYCSGHARSLGLIENWSKTGPISDDAG